MGLRSIDYTLKKYVEDDTYEEKDESLGGAIHLFLSENLERSHRELLKFTVRDVVRVGDMIADMNLVRIYSSLKAAHLLANRGLLFETLCLVRFVLEQLAWTKACETMTDEDAIMKLQATECITAFKTVYPHTGRLY